MGRRRNSVGRNHRKRTLRRMRKSLYLEMVDGQWVAYSDSGVPKVKFDPVAEVPTSGQLLAQYRQHFIVLHERHLRSCATKLGAPGCWEYYHLNLEHARKYHYEEDFRHLVVEAASRFLGQPVRTAYGATSPE